MNIVQFQKRIWDFYGKNKRDFAWRKQITPYKILVSEVMLQQTQVSRVAAKYKEFIKTFPNLPTLAKASPAAILAVWSGLGYNRRALYLKRAAEMAVAEYGGKLPKNHEQLVLLPGVGKNTAGAILAYAYNLPAIFIETNIRRTYIHHFFPGQKNISDAQLMPVIEETLDAKNPRKWYWALMDYGSFLGTVVENPNRQSKQYAKQSKFEGSLRQLRGKILKYLLEKKRISSKELHALMKDSRYPLAERQLVAEGFISKNKNAVFLKK